LNSGIILPGLTVCPSAMKRARFSGVFGSVAAASWRLPPMRDRSGPIDAFSLRAAHGMAGTAAGGEKRARRAAARPRPAGAGGLGRRARLRTRLAASLRSPAPSAHAGRRNIRRIGRDRCRDDRPSAAACWCGRDHVELAAEARHPEGMDHVGERSTMSTSRPTGRRISFASASRLSGRPG
jgi:hypothetical protein